MDLRPFSYYILFRKPSNLMLEPADVFEAVFYYILFTKSNVMLEPADAFEAVFLLHSI